MKKRKDKFCGTVIRGDCVEVMQAWVADGDCGTTDLVLADPPYNIGVDYGSGRGDDMLAPEEYGEWCREWIGLCARALRPGGSLWVVSGQEHGARIDLAIQDAGLIIRNRITWHESFGVYCHRKFGRTSRPIYYAVKPGAPFTFNDMEVRIPSARQSKYRDKRAHPNGKIMGDVWSISRVCGTFRERVKGVPTQLPYKLVSRILGVATNEGDTILDPFAGSGTSLRVAVDMGRDAIGIEKSPEYFAIAEERLTRSRSATS